MPTGAESEFHGPLFSGEGGLAEQGYDPCHFGGSARLFRSRAQPIPTTSTLSMDRRSRTRSQAQAVCLRSRSGLRGGRSEMSKVLSLAPDNARAHMYLGLVEIWTKRAAQGIAECEHALALDRNLASAHHFIGLGKIYRARRRNRDSDCEALRLSPRDTLTYVWVAMRASRSSTSEATSRQSGGVGGRSRPTEIIRSRIFCWGPRWRCLVVWTRRIPPSRPASRSTRPSLFPAPAPSGRLRATIRRTLPSSSPFSKACARPGSRAMRGGVGTGG